MVVSLSCFGSISPKPLKRETSTLPSAVELGLEQLGLMRVVPRVSCLGTLAQAIERRHGEIEMAVIDQPAHFR